MLTYNLIVHEINPLTFKVLEVLVYLCHDGMYTYIKKAVLFLNINLWKLKPYLSIKLLFHYFYFIYKSWIALFAFIGQDNRVI